MASKEQNDSAIFFSSGSDNHRANFAKVRSNSPKTDRQETKTFLTKQVRK